MPGWKRHARNRMKVAEQMAHENNQQRELAKRLIESDQAVTSQEDEVRDLLEDCRSWGVDLARTIIGPDEEREIRESVKADYEKERD